MASDLLTSATAEAASLVESALSTAADVTAPSSSFVATSATAAKEIIAQELQSPTSKIWTFISFVGYSIRLLQRISFWMIGFSTFTLPTWLFTLFSMSLTFTMNFTTLMVIFLIFGSIVSWAVRYRLLNNYNRLPPEPQRKEPEIDLFPDSLEGDSKPGLSSYLDEFLSAIKVFGYLERPVFHELTRSMQTRKLIAGETLLLEEEKGFCIVVDGLVQVFVKAARNDSAGAEERAAEGYGGAFHDEEEEAIEGNQGYQLLTEVKNGAPMSSLFTILSLFTEDVKLRHDDDDESGVSASSSMVNLQAAGESTAHMNNFGSPLDAHGDARSLPPRTGSSFGHLPAVPPMSLNEERGGMVPETPHHEFHPHPAPRGQRPKTKKSKSVHPDIVARATVDTTIAVIPASAFKRLTRIYPKASAHIVQVILTRFQRVTYLTGYNYLGLTAEVLRSEKFMNLYTMYELPNYLRGGALDRLKEKFKKEQETAEPEDSMKGIVLHNPAAGRRRRSSSSLRKDVAAHARLAAARGVPSTPLDAGFKGNPEGLKAKLKAQHPIHTDNSFPRSWTTSPPGGIDVSSPMGERSFNPFAEGMMKFMQESREENEDAAFREAVLECMFKAIGLTGSAVPGAVARGKAGTESGEQSPRMVSYDAKKQKAVFSNAFGYIDPFDGNDGDSDSVASTNISAASTSGFGASVGTVYGELKDDVEIVYFPKGAVLVEQGERNPGLYYVIDGFLDVSIPVDEKMEAGAVLGGTGESRVNLGGLGVEADLPPLTRTATSSSNFSNGPPNVPTGGRGRKKTGRKSLFMIKPGGIAGYIGSISSYRSFIDVRAKTDVYVGFLPRAALERIVDRYPVVLLTMAKRLTSLLPRLILHIDFALEWLQVNAGQVIYHQGDESDAIYIVLNGRLRAVLEGKDGGMSVVGEYGQGESVGELEVMTETTRPATLHAIRDTEVARFPKTLFNSLALEHPGITIQISKIIASRMRALVEDPLLEQGRTDRSGGSQIRKASSVMNLRTVCVLPITAGVPVTEFAHRLSNALTQIGTPNGVTLLNQAAIMNHLGRHAFSRMGKLKLQGYLADLEEKYGMVLYVADTNVNAPWTQTCISQADSILLVGLAEGSPAVGEYERFLVGMKTTARKELVLLHIERYCAPGLTRQWLKNRMWVNGGHHHIQMAFKTTPEPVHSQAKRFGSVLKQRVQILQAEITKYTSRRVRNTPIYSSETPVKSDFHRLARRLCGKSVGLVLGGGGARGISQVGVIKALEEAGIPIDIVGGTSIGAFVGALYSRDADIVPVYGRAKKFAGRMASLWRFVLDLTYPSVSYTTGHEFNRGIFKTFANSQIEDFWLEFYCNTTSISKSRMEIHNSGYAWRYIRASMSLAGLLPPLCDEGDMLLDGGYVDNLTVAHMKSLGADVVFAVDVGSIDDDTPQTYGDSLSGFWTFMNRWNPFSSYPNPPTLAEIQARLAYVSSVDALERAKAMPGCIYMRPPIDAYGTLDFGKFDEIYQVGYQYGQKFLEGLKGRGGLKTVGVGTGSTGAGERMRRQVVRRRASI
ncbi:phosphatidylcholine and lysophosphatidylcholine phospholipase [Rhizina undulata]